MIDRDQALVWKDHHEWLGELMRALAAGRLQRRSPVNSSKWNSVDHLSFHNQPDDYRRAPEVILEPYTLATIVEVIELKRIIVGPDLFPMVIMYASAEGVLLDSYSDDHKKPYKQVSYDVLARDYVFESNADIELACAPIPRPGRATPTDTSPSSRTGMSKDEADKKEPENAG